LQYAAENAVYTGFLEDLTTKYDNIYYDEGAIYDVNGRYGHPWRMTEVYSVRLTYHFLINAAIASVMPRPTRKPAAKSGTRLKFLSKIPVNNSSRPIGNTSRMGNSGFNIKII
jgi:hypothetical protein